MTILPTRFYPVEEMRRMLKEEPEKLIGKIIIDKFNRAFICTGVDRKNRKLLGYLIERFRVGG